MSAALSIQKHSLVILPSNTFSDVELTGDPADDHSNCVPFITSRVSATPNDNDFTEYAVHITLKDGVDEDPNFGRVFRFAGGTAVSEMTVEFTLVEFDPALVTVHTASETISAKTTHTVDITSLGIVKDDTFLYFCPYGPASTSYDAMQLKGEIVSNTTLTFTRASSGPGSSYVRWFLVQAISGSKPWSVQHVDLDLSDAESFKTLTGGTDFTEVDMDKTFLLGSLSMDANSAANAEGTAHTVLWDDAGTQKITRARGTHVNAMPGFVEIVTFAAGEAGAVYRGSISSTTGDDDDPISAEVTPGDCHVQFAGSHGGFTSGAFPGTATSDCPDAHCTLTINGAGTEVNCLHDTTGGESANVAWEVIDWMNEPATAQRRIILCS